MANDLDDNMTSNVIKFTDDTKVFRKKCLEFFIKKKIMIFFNPERLYNLATGVEGWSHYPMSPLHFIGVLVKRQQPISVIIETLH